MLVQSLCDGQCHIIKGRRFSKSRYVTEQSWFLKRKQFSVFHNLELIIQTNKVVSTCNSSNELHNEKTNNVVSEQVQHKPSLTST